MITAITVAAMHLDRAALLRCLRLDDVDIDHIDDRGWTPLHWVAHRGDQALAQLLLLGGASLRKKTEKGECAHDLAFQAGHLELGGFLKTLWVQSSARVSLAL